MLPNLSPQQLTWLTLLKTQILSNIDTTFKALYLAEELDNLNQDDIGQVADGLLSACRLLSNRTIAGMDDDRYWHSSGLNALAFLYNSQSSNPTKVVKNHADNMPDYFYQAASALLPSKDPLIQILAAFKGTGTPLELAEFFINDQKLS